LIAERATYVTAAVRGQTQRGLCPRQKRMAKAHPQQGRGRDGCFTCVCFASAEPKVFLPELAGNSHPLRPPPDPLSNRAPETAGQFRASLGCSARPAPTERVENRGSTLRGWEFPANSGAVRLPFQTSGVALLSNLIRWLAERNAPGVSCPSADRATKRYRVPLFLGALRLHRVGSARQRAGIHYAISSQKRGARVSTIPSSRKTSSARSSPRGKPGSR